MRHPPSQASGTFAEGAGFKRPVQKRELKRRVISKRLLAR
jgi:hypothetical protein